MQIYFSRGKATGLEEEAAEQGRVAVYRAVSRAVNRTQHVAQRARRAISGQGCLTLADRGRCGKGALSVGTYVALAQRGERLRRIRCRAWQSLSE